MTSVQRGSSEKYRARFQDSPNKADANVYLERIKRQTKPQKAELKVTDFHIRSMVVSRYAQTTVESSVWNQLAVNKEAAFEVDLPSTAFISNFSITSNGKVYVAEVKERSQAKKIYDEAKKRGKTAGLVATKERETEKFRVAVSVPAGSQMTFTLTYEELLQRRLGRYELALSVRPEQPVSNLTVGVTISERTGISFVRVLPLRKTKLLSNTVQADAEMPPSTEVLRSPSCARISFTPTIKEQTVMSTKGISADFVVQYDVELKDLIGDVQIYDGYFVHYFAPRGLPVVPKDVIFVIDTSGSMLGTKIKQTKEAMKIILSDLRENDYFNIITFSHSVNTWKTETTIKATPKNVKEAQAFVKKISASGSTDINSALLNAAKLVNTKNPRKGSGNHVPLIIFLTDGEPTTGVTSGERIVNNAKEALGTASLFGLAFGNDADYPLMRRLSMENRGVARMIYEDADATLQLKGFYDEVASPLLFDIQLNYLDNHVYDVTRALFPNFFQGSELVVAGRIKPGVKDLKVKVNAMDSEKQLTVENDVTVPSSGNATFGCPGDLQGISGFVRRLWAYFTIKDLLQAKLNNTDPATQRILTEKATNLSLKYNFVSPVTSLVVVKPDTEEASLNATPTHTTSTVTHTPFLFSKLALHSTRKSDTTTTSSSKTSKPRPESVPSTKFPGHPSGLQTTGRVLPTSTSFPAKTVASPESQSRTATSEHRPTTASAAPGGLSTNRTDAFWVTAPAPPPGTTAMPHITEMGTDIEIARFISATFMPMLGEALKIPLAGRSVQTELQKASKRVFMFFPNQIASNPPIPPTNISLKAKLSMKPKLKTPASWTSFGTVSLPALSLVFGFKNKTFCQQMNICCAILLQLKRTESTAIIKCYLLPPLRPLVIAGSCVFPLIHFHFSFCTVDVSSVVQVKGITKFDSIVLLYVLTFIPITTAILLRSCRVINMVLPTSSLTEFRCTFRHVKIFREQGILEINVENVSSNAKYLSWKYSISNVDNLNQINRAFNNWRHYWSLYFTFCVQSAQLCKTMCIQYIGSFGSASSRLIFAGSADGDPHFVVHLPKLSENICFTIDGLPNDVLRLVDDPEKGLTVDGHLMWAPSKVGFEDKTRTYFSQLSFSVKMGSAEPWNITVSLGSIVLEGEEQVTMFTDRTGTVKVRDLKITIDSNQTAWVTVGQDIGFMVLFHHYKHPTYLQLSHLGLYIANGQGLSPSTHGLLGQFQHADIEILRTTDTARHAEVNTEGKQAMGELRRNGERIPIVLVDKKLKDSVKKKHAGRCWVIAKPDVEKLIGGTYQSFVVDHL
uniref:Inter-alpha-trypsin inhibitor heavy chain family member 6 n=1 Tax=Lepisosteus oculatus TaxID=7918 RepID=W5NEI6_LEPOC